MGRGASGLAVAMCDCDGPQRYAVCISAALASSAGEMWPAGEHSTPPVQRSLQRLRKSAAAAECRGETRRPDGGYEYGRALAAGAREPSVLAAKRLDPQPAADGSFI